MTFREFLQKKAGEQRPAEYRRRRDEWIAACSRLRDLLGTWLAEADPDHVLAVTALEVERAEQGLGTYVVPGLQISLGDNSVRVVPIARNVVGHFQTADGTEVRAEGRVDITDGVRKYLLYRRTQNGEDHWYILGEDYRPALLDRARLESALQDLLS